MRSKYLTVGSKYISDFILKNARTYTCVSWSLCYILLLSAQIITWAIHVSSIWGKAVIFYLFDVLFYRCMQKLNKEIVFLNRKCCKSSADRTAKLYRLSLHVSLCLSFISCRVIHHKVINESFIGAFIHNFYILALLFVCLLSIGLFKISGSKVYIFFYSQLCYKWSNNNSSLN